MLHVCKEAALSAAARPSAPGEADHSPPVAASPRPRLPNHCWSQIVPVLANGRFDSTTIGTGCLIRWSRVEDYGESGELGHFDSPMVAAEIAVRVKR